MVEKDIETRMEALRRQILKAVKVDSIATYKELSLALGQNQTFVQQFVTKKSPKRLYDDQINIITKIIEGRSVKLADQDRPIGAIEPLDPDLEQEYLERLRAADPAVRDSVLTLLGLRSKS